VHRRRRRGGGFWIQEALQRPGALRAYVRRRYGKRGFTPKGTIRVALLKRLAKKKGKLGRRARLALTLRRLRR